MLMQLLMIIMGILSIPGINLTASIVSTPIVNRYHDMTVVGVGQVGHLEGTGWVTDEYRAALAAHNTDAFQDLDQVLPGTMMYIETSEAIYTYKVTERHYVLASDISWLAPKTDNSLVLITCYSNTYEQAGKHKYRLIILGELQYVTVKSS